MSRKLTRTLLTAVMLSSLMMLLASTTASAGAQAWKGPLRYVTVSTYLSSPPNPLPPDNNPCFKSELKGPGTPGFVLQQCVSGNIMGNDDYAKAEAYADEDTCWVKTKTKGHAGAGGRLSTMSLVPSTSDSIVLTSSITGPSQVQFTLAGTMFLDPSTVDPKQAAQTLRVSVYPDTNAAKAGTPALWRGEIRTWGNRDLSQAQTSGQFAPGDISVSHGAGNTITVTLATGLTKTVNGVPVPANAVFEVKGESASLQMPGLPPVGSALLTLLLATAGCYVLQTRRRAAAV